MGPAFSSDDLSEPESRDSSMPGSYDADKGGHFPMPSQREGDVEMGKEGRVDDDDDAYDDDDNFDDDLLATGEMRNVPF